MNPDATMITSPKPTAGPTLSGTGRRARHEKIDDRKAQQEEPGRPPQGAEQDVGEYRADRTARIR